MKFFVISDTHGKIDKALEIYGRLTEIDAIIHLGDMQRDAIQIASATGKEVISIKGNNDGAYSCDDHRILNTEFGNMLLIHGHLQHVKFDLQKLHYRTEELGCKAVLFGHTHMPLFIEASGIYFVNPGSLTLPADGGGGSYAIVHTAKGEFNASIVYYAQAFRQPLQATEKKSPGTKPVTGGYLRNLLNNSDRR